jgi:hypothetical protein
MDIVICTHVLEASTTTGMNDAGNSETTTAKVVRRLTGSGEFIVERVLKMDDTHVYYMGTQAGYFALA